MATQVQFRRGTKPQHTSFTGVIGEVTVNTTNKSLHVHDGTTAGGFEAARADLSNATGVGILTVTNLSVTGIGTITVGSIPNLSGTNLNYSGITTTNNLIATNIRVSGVTTSINGFVGNLTGNVVGNVTGNLTGTATTATNLSDAGNIVTGTIAAERLATANNFSILNNLNVNGNITIGGTSSFIAARELIVSDKDIVIGYTTDSSNNDASTDTTANHGGISVASTEGTPLISLSVVGINTLPDTYKQIMWVKSGTFSGLATDSWISNYPISIGTTSAPRGTRLAVGSGVTVTNDTVNSINLNVSGISTLSTIRLSAGDISSLVSTAATTSATQIFSVSASTCRSAVFQVQSVEGINYNMTTINVIHDGTETYMTEYGTINQPIGIATFATDINGGNLRLLAYPASSNSTTFKVISTAVNV